VAQRQETFHRSRIGREAEWRLRALEGLLQLVLERLRHDSLLKRRLSRRMMPQAGDASLHVSQPIALWQTRVPLRWFKFST
jgi:hypothetical protein